MHSKESQSLSALIVEPNREKATQLKIRLMQLPEYGEIFCCDRFQDAVTCVSVGQGATDVVFLSTDCPNDRLSDLISEIQKIKQGECAVFIALVRPNQGTIRSFADALLVGAHGSLSEPFSVGEVEQVTQHSLKLRVQLRTAREVLALKILLKQAMKAIDLVSQHFKLSKSPGLALKEMKDAGSSLHVAAERNRELYKDMLLDLLPKASLPDFLPGIENYTGKSQAVQRRRKRRLDQLSKG